MSRKLVLGVGLYEKGDYVSKIGYTHTQEYRKWMAMLNRCCSEKFKLSVQTYEHCKMSEEFHKFQYFASWCNRQHGFNKGWHLDKDILIKGNKVYSENTCVFVPSDINVAFVKCDKARGDCPVGVSWHSRDCVFTAKVNTGKFVTHLGYFDSPEDAFLVYKIAKEKYIKSLAYKWKDEVDTRVFQALLNYEVEITD